MGDDPPDGEDREPTDGIDDVVVRCDHDHHERDERVGARQDLGAARLHSGDQGERAPGGPRDVNAGHGRVLVGDPRRRAGIERPERRVLLQRVDEPDVQVLEVEQAGWHERVDREPDQCERGGDGKGVAEARVVVAVLAEQPHSDPDRDDEVERSVEIVGGDDQRLRVQRPALDRRLVEDPEVVLERDDLLRVLEGAGGVRAVGVPDRGVHEVEAEDREHLDPPVENVTVAEATPAFHHRAAAGRRGLGIGHGCVVSEPAAPLSAAAVCRCPIAKSGAPIKLTTNNDAYQSRPAVAAALPLMPSPKRNHTNAPSRTPRPPNDSGITCSIDTAGTNASAAAIGTYTSSARKMSAYAPTIESW